MGEVNAAWRAPELLSSDYRISEFDCGVPPLDEWLRKRAYPNQLSGASRTFLVLSSEAKVAGYYALAAGAMALREAPSTIRRNMADPVPMVVIGRLAVDRAWRGHGLGLALLGDAVQRATDIARQLGVRGVLAHAISEEARAFYLRQGFVPAPGAPLTLVLPLKRF